MLCACLCARCVRMLQDATAGFRLIFHYDKTSGISAYSKISFQSCNRVTFNNSAEAVYGCSALLSINNVIAFNISFLKIQFWPVLAAVFVVDNIDIAFFFAYRFDCSSAEIVRIFVI